MGKPTQASRPGKRNAETKPATQYEPTAREKAAIDQFDSKRAARIPMVSMRHSGGSDSKPELGIDHEDPLTAVQLWTVSLGTDDTRFADAITGQLANLSLRSGQFSIDLLNQHMAFVQNIAPQNSLEAALAAQMAAVHSTMMDMARRLSTATTFQQVDIYERAMNKLARTFATQMETLKRYRGGGVQKVIVQHVQVNDGGQALVAGELHGGGGKSENRGQPHERDDMRLSESPAMLGALEAVGVPMQGASSDRLECMQVPRGTGRAAEGASQ